MLQNLASEIRYVNGVPTPVAYAEARYEFSVGGLPALGLQNLQGLGDLYTPLRIDPRSKNGPAMLKALGAAGEPIIY